MILSILILKVYFQIQEVCSAKSEWHPMVNRSNSGNFRHFVSKNWLPSQGSFKRDIARNDESGNYQHPQINYPYQVQEDSIEQKHHNSFSLNENQHETKHPGAVEVEGSNEDQMSQMTEDGKNKESESKEKEKESTKGNLHKEVNSGKQKEKEKEEGKKENKEGEKPSEGGDEAIGAIPIKDQTLLKAKEIAELLGLKGISWVTICLLLVLCGPVFIPTLLTPISIIITLIVFSPELYRRKKKEIEEIKEYFDNIQYTIWDGIKKFEYFDITDMF